MSISKWGNQLFNSKCRNAHVRVTMGLLEMYCDKLMPYVANCLPQTCSPSDIEMIQNYCHDSYN